MEAPPTICWSEGNGELFKALAQSQSEMGSAFKDAVNPHFRSRYATLQSVLNAVLPALNKNGISLSQHPSLSDGLVSVTTLLTHTSGQWMSSTCSLPLGGRKDGHALKSATTYLRRTACVSICGLPEEDDDDGNSASMPSRGRAPQRPRNGAPQHAAGRGSFQLPPVPEQPKMTEAELNERLTPMNLTAQDMVQWCAANGHPSPMEMDRDRAIKMLGWLGGSGEAEVRKWFASQQGSAPNDETEEYGAR